MLFGKNKVIRRKNSLLKRLTSFKREIAGLLMGSFIALLTLSLLSYDPTDRSWFYFSSESKELSNWCGIFGANIAAGFLYLFGSISFLLVAFISFLFVLYVLRISFLYNLDRILAFILMACTGSGILRFHNLDFTKSHAGGLVGYKIYNSLSPMLGISGAAILLYALLWISVIVLFRFSLVGATVKLVKGAFYSLYMMFKAFRKAYRFLGRNKKVAPEVKVIQVQSATVEEDWNTSVWSEFKDNSLHDIFSDGRTQEFLGKEVYFMRNSVFMKNIFTMIDDVDILSSSKFIDRKAFNLPDLSIFKANEISSHEMFEIEERCKDRALKLEEKLSHFGIEGSVTAILPGPVVTLFEYAPEIGTKISKILTLEDDLALALKALSIRIIAPIPGRNVVGLEISNERRDNVLLSEVLLSEDFHRHEHVLPLALGVDIVGNPVIEDLLNMPHLLVAGSTGSGKSVGLNSMLVSMLCHLRPDEMRLILIDPKRLEFSAYKDIPHLLFPIVTEPRQVPIILKWVIAEMERRYELMAIVGVRNLSDYKKLKNKAVSKVEMEDLPFMVIIIDELADLMMVAGKEVEIYVARIAQMARAAGIHMIIATQRPSVDVITGTIKVNFPSRISFKVTSKVDSKTIIDFGGAEKLLGKGDMLFTDPKSSDLKRVHGAFVSDEEINKLTKQLRSQKAVEYLDLDELVKANAKSAENIEDDLYKDIVDYVKTVEEVSISMLQRKYRIGFNRSARIIEKLELSGVIAPAQGGKPRKVIH